MAVLWLIIIVEYFQVLLEQRFYEKLFQVATKQIEREK